MINREVVQESEKILIFYLISILLGILTGLLGTAFQYAAGHMATIRDVVAYYLASFSFIPGVISMMLICALMVLFACYLVARFAPEAQGSGVQEIEGILLAKRPIYWRRLLPVKFIAGMFAIGANMVVGREGPTIQMGGNLGEMLGEKLNLTREKRNILIGAGAASGLAVAFNAPLAGIVFILEEMREQFQFSFLSFKSVAISCVFATIVLRIFLGQGPTIDMPLFSSPDLLSLFLFFIFGIVVGFFGLAFNVFLMRSLKMVEPIRSRFRLSFGFAVGALIGLVTWYLPEAAGGGYQIISDALHVSMALQFLVMMIILRFILTMVCYSSGVPGGIFAPMLAIGTLLGVAFGNVAHFIFNDPHVYADMFAVAGMGALFAASIRAPVTGIILIVEMTQNYTLILPSMMTCLTATTVVQLAKNPPIYSQLLERVLKGNKK